MKNTKIIGILNVTPDSFADSGQYFSHRSALQRVQEMIDMQIDVIDVGAESTRPASGAVSIVEEKERLEILPKIYELAKAKHIQISLDSRNYETIRKYINYIDIINDVSGFYDVRLQNLALDHGKKVVLMHSISVPVIKGEYIKTDDIVDYLRNWLESRMQDLNRKGFANSQIIFDPGIGFGTSVEQSFEVVRRVKEFSSSEISILIGHSRKSFLSVLGESEANKRDPETHALTFYLAQAGVNYVRVHDVEASRRIIKMTQFF
jgi:dihydropteroate synthase